ncbi:MAG: STN domain-containing protein [Pseudomonadota bacterium]
MTYNEVGHLCRANKRGFRLFFSQVTRLSVLVVWAGICFGAQEDRSAAEQRLTTEHPIAFDIPSQPLVAAIERYSIISSLQVIYDASLATGRRSTAIKGEYTAAAALSRLLSGTGLKPDYVAADGAMLVPNPIEVRTLFIRYYGHVQTGLRRALCADPRLRAGSYRLAFGVWIGRTGAVSRVVLLGSTGKSDVDAIFDRLISNLSFGRAPPLDFAQPIVVLVTPKLIEQCDDVNANGRLIRANQ